VQPQLVILCVHMDDVEGFRVLSMLKLDADTRSIPILTYTIDDDDEPQDEEPEPADDQMFVSKPALQMH
jgi:PleD family two-component response regulator